MAMWGDVLWEFPQGEYMIRIANLIPAIPGGHFDLRIAHHEGRYAVLWGDRVIGTYNKSSGIKYFRSLIVQELIDRGVPPHEERQNPLVVKCRNCGVSVPHLFYEADDEVGAAYLFSEGICSFCRADEVLERRKKEERAELHKNAMDLLADVAPEYDRSNKPGGDLNQRMSQEDLDKLRSVVASSQDKSKVAKPSNPVPGRIENYWQNEDGNVGATATVKGEKVNIHLGNVYSNTYNESEVREKLRKMGLYDG